MNFKRYDGFIGAAPQRKIDNELPKCPFCGQHPHWLLDIQQGFSSVGVTCMCEKCNGKLFMENRGISYENDLRVVDTGNINSNNIQLNGSYHIMSLKSLAEKTPNCDAFSNENKTPQIVANNLEFNDKTSNKNTSVIVGVISVILIFIVCLWAFIPGGASPSSSQLQPVRQSSMSVEESFGYYYVTISGSAKNTSKKTMDYVSITFSLYDSSGNIVGTAIANQTSIGPGETWVYSATGISSTNRPISHKSTDVTVICY